ncbi:UNVERIFIED_CONTAM: hypothetical protein GTU68_023089 [Idotea baltica]|nr:hypothetical protein [Idotea baltica]
MPRVRTTIRSAPRIPS